MSDADELIADPDAIEGFLMSLVAAEAITGQQERALSDFVEAYRRTRDRAEKAEADLATSEAQRAIYRDWVSPEDHAAAIAQLDALAAAVRCFSVECMSLVLRLPDGACSFTYEGREVAPILLASWQSLRDEALGESPAGRQLDQEGG